MSDDTNKNIAERLGGTITVAGGGPGDIHVGEDRYAGAVYVIIDRQRSGDDSKLIVAYDIDTLSILYECTLFHSMVYEEETPQIHHFNDSDGKQITVHFYDKEDARMFKNKIHGLMPLPPTVVVEKKQGFLKRLFSNSGKKKKDKKEKDKQKTVQLGKPKNFSHKSHIGFDPKGGFNERELPKEWMSVFAEAGVEADDLQDSELSQLIYLTCKGVMQKNVPSAPPVPIDAQNRSASAAMATASPSSSKDNVSGDAEHKEQEEEKVDLLTLLKAGVKLKPVKVEKDDYTVMDVNKITKEKRLSMISTLRAVMEHRRARTGPLIQEWDEESEDEEESSASEFDE